jgi:hypothetical protein
MRILVCPVILNPQLKLIEVRADSVKRLKAEAEQKYKENLEAFKNLQT